MNKAIGIIVFLASLAGCETTTGVKSECFGRTKSDGSYSATPQVTRDKTPNYFLGTRGSSERTYGCDFQNF